VTLVRKSEFANLCNVSNGRVSQWLTEGKIDGEAIVGTGQRAQINVEVAREQLKLRLATDERYGLNGLGTKLDGPTVPNLPVSQVREGETVGMTDEQMKEVKLKQQQLLLAKMAYADLALKGVYANTREAAGGFSKVATEMMAMIEGWFPDLASAHAAKRQISQRESLHLTREEFRKIRDQMAVVWRNHAAKMPKIIDED
jgi:hypothetical protein